MDIFDKKKKIMDLYLHHVPTFTVHKINDPCFIPKVAYVDKKLGVKVISFFPSELKKGVDIYTEFSSKTYDVEDESRTLYKWKYNPHYNTDYELSEPHNATSDRRYLVPVSELTVVNAPNLLVRKTLNAPVTVEDEFSLPDPDMDLPFDQLTIRDLAAILLKKPVSMKSWLNEIIKKK